jgi:putative nucleotidyltransferase with HDIG domain
VPRSETKSLPGAARPRVTEHAQRRTRRLQLVLSVLVTSLLLGALLTLDLGELGPLPLGGGLPEVGQIADRSYKAPADIQIVDREATEELRRATLEQAPAVYDFDERRGSQLRERIRAAFQAARDALAQGPAPASAEAAVGAFRQALAPEVPPGAAVGALRARRFSESDERTLLALSGAVAGRMVLDDAAELRRELDKRAVLVRELGSGRERRLFDAEALLDLASAQEQVREFAERTSEGRARQERQQLLELALALVRPNVQLNLRATEERRQAAAAGVKDVAITLRKGEIIVRDGDPITARHVRILDGLREQEVSRSQLGAFTGVAVACGVMLTVMWRFGSSAIARFPRDVRDAVFLLTSFVLTALGIRIGLFLCDSMAERPELVGVLGEASEVLYYAIPVATTAMLVRLVQSAETSAMFAVGVAILAGLQVQGQVEYTLFTLVGSLTAALGAGRVTQRGTLLRAGLRLGLANAVVVAALSLVGGELRPASTLLGIGLAFCAGPLCGVLVSGLAPLVETLFAYTTDVKLLELANREQRVLRELEMQAPGTYHHSMMVGHLAEKAAEGIGANALLAKVAGYYHDIGKMRRPHFFVENVTVHGGENRHERLAPSMSARIIQAHVRDGLELGRQHKLAPPILSGIGEHHGTSIIRFFYEKAKELADPEKGDEVVEHDYRYPGPKPQTREAGILMLADSVEAASRTLTDTSPARIQQLVQRIINNYFRDGQLDECSLTLRDLHSIARSFIDTLSAIRHQRIDYPEASDAEGRDEAADEGVVERLEPRSRDRSERASEKRDHDLKRLGLP